MIKDGDAYSDSCRDESEAVRILAGLLLRITDRIDCLEKTLNGEAED
jgi:hypothetical protein